MNNAASNEASRNEATKLHHVETFPTWYGFAIVERLTDGRGTWTGTTHEFDSTQYDAYTRKLDEFRAAGLRVIEHESYDAFCDDYS